MTRFSDLANLPRTDSGLPRRDVFEALDLPAPLDVREQFYFDHSGNPEFQRQYGHLVLEAVEWREERLTSFALQEVTVNPGYQKWVESVASRAPDVPVAGWRALDVRKDVATHWEAHRTWVRPPVLIEGSWLGRTGLHLVEGHSRLGALRGLVRAGLVPPDAEHRAWVGWRT